MTILEEECSASTNVVQNTRDAQGQARAWQTGFMSRGLTALAVGIQTVLRIISLVDQRFMSVA